MEDNQVEGFKLSLNGAGIDIKTSVDRKAALAVLSIIWGEAPVSMQVSTPEAKPTGQTPPVSMGEYLHELGSSTNKERIAAIGLYLRKHKGKETFTKDDVVAGYRNAHISLPKNIPRDISGTAAARWIEAIEPSGNYYVTSTGAQAVEGKLAK